jgi:hypothetical protein
VNRAILSGAIARGGTSEGVNRAILSGAIARGGTSEGVNRAIKPRAIAAVHQVIETGVRTFPPRHGPARPGHLSQHNEESDGPIEPGNDGIVPRFNDSGYRPERRSA